MWTSLVKVCGLTGKRTMRKGLHIILLISLLGIFIGEGLKLHRAVLLDSVSGKSQLSHEQILIETELLGSETSTKPVPPSLATSTPLELPPKQSPAEKEAAADEDDATLKTRQQAPNVERMEAATESLKLNRSANQKPALPMEEDSKSPVKQKPEPNAEEKPKPSAKQKPLQPPAEAKAKPSANQMLESPNNRKPVPSSYNVTVVIMNHRKPKTLLGSKLMPILLDNSRVDEILLLHSNPATRFDYDHPKVVNINATQENESMGLSLRFHFCHLRARNPWVLFVDDDQSPPPTAVDHVLYEMERNSKRIVGAYGRGQRYDGSYTMKTIFGPVEVVLTKFMVMERELCSAFFQYQHIVFEDVVKLHSFPLWNGEDIFMSQVANHVYKQMTLPKPTDPNPDKRNLAINLKVREARVLDKDATGVSGTSGTGNQAKQLNHSLYRSMMWNTAKARLATFVGGDTKSLDYEQVPMWNEQPGLPGDKLVSVIIMNIDRPPSLEQSLLPTLTKDKHVGDILLHHVNPETRFMYQHPKVSNHIVKKDNWEENGLSVQYQYCQKAKHRWVLFVDEGQILPPNTIARLLGEFESNPKRLVGAYGRQLGAGGEYNDTNVYGAVEVMLSKLVVMERELCDAFFNYQHFLLDDVVVTSDSDSFWDGADIFMSLLANHFYKVTNLAPKDRFSNLAIPLGIAESNLLEGSGTSTAKGSSNISSQKSMYRSRVWSIGKSRLTALEEDYNYIRQKAKKFDPEQPPNVTVIIQNHDRTKTILGSSLLPTLTEHPSVNEVMILHSNPETRFNYSHPKVSNIDAKQANDEICLAKRFLFCQQARNPWIIMIDDDQELEPSAITEVLAEFAHNTHRIVGSHGRGLNNVNEYCSRTLHGRVEMVLTKYMIMEKEMCDAFFRYHHLVLHDIVKKHSTPLWNGEDIFMSHVANHVNRLRGLAPKSKANNFALDVPIREAKVLDEGKFGISGNGINKTRVHLHFQYRTKMWHAAKARLAALIQAP